ncbi:MAG: glycerate kinase [Planctomycetes bacterium]|nr:glycerate kinase [Planctomycetota bacterium]
MKILIAPDKFKDALDAPAVAEALAAGARAALPDAEIVCCPLGDGGEGTGRLLASVRAAQERTAVVQDPIGRQRVAHWWLDVPGGHAIIEMAEASGLALLDDAERDALRTSSYGTGQLLLAAANAGCRRVTLCVGGSASVDGGAGCLQALGWELRDADGRALPEPATGATLSRVAGARPPGSALELKIDILCDVVNPLLGPRGAAPVFAPQKGATPAQVRVLEEGLQRWAAVLARVTGREVATMSRGGAAGGVPAALAATTDARLLAGFNEVARRLHLPALLARSDLCLSGEGCLDEQTVGGKVVGSLARLAGDPEVPVLAFVGAVQPAQGQTVAQLAQAIGLHAIVPVTPPGTPLRVALATTDANLRRAASAYLAADARDGLP